jgi:hypothetical protein
MASIQRFTPEIETAVSLMLREKHRLRLFDNRVLRRIFGPKRDGVTGNGEVAQ